MSIATLIQLIAACIGIIGSLFFATGIMRQSVETMARISGSYWDWNPHMVATLAAQKADYLFGGGLIVIAFVLQLGSFFAPVDPTALSYAQARIAPWVAGALTAVLFTAFRLAAVWLAKHYEAQINAWLKQRVDQSET